jgi:hypothetical protein
VRFLGSIPRHNIFYLVFEYFILFVRFVRVAGRCIWFKIVFLRVLVHVYLQVILNFLIKIGFLKLENIWVIYGIFSCLLLHWGLTLILYKLCSCMFEFVRFERLIKFLKSGMLFDYIFKRFVRSILIQLYNYCLVFLEKFFVEYCYIHFRKFSKTTANYSDLFRNESFFSNFGILILLSLIIFILIM